MYTFCLRTVDAVIIAEWTMQKEIGSFDSAIKFINYERRFCIFMMLEHRLGRGVCVYKLLKLFSFFVGVIIPHFLQFFELLPRPCHTNILTHL